MSNTQKDEMLKEMRDAGFDGRFCMARKKEKSSRKNRYDSYMKWAVLLYKNNVGEGEIESPKYAFPSSVLAYIRDIVPGDIKGVRLLQGYSPW